VSDISGHISGADCLPDKSSNPLFRFHLFHLVCNTWSVSCRLPVICLCWTDVEPRRGWCSGRLGTRPNVEQECRGEG